MNPLEKLKNEIEKRIRQYEKSDEAHMNDIMNLEMELSQKEEKRVKVQQMLKEAMCELDEVNEFIKWKSEQK